MFLYSYDAQTGVYLGRRLARVDPIETALAKQVDEKAGPIFLIPEHTTPIAPPQVGDKEIAIFDPVDYIWKIKPDRRGETWWREANQEVVTKIGDPNGDGLSVDPPIEIVRAIKRNELTKAYENDSFVTFDETLIQCSSAVKSNLLLGLMTNTPVTLWVGRPGEQVLREFPPERINALVVAIQEKIKQTAVKVDNLFHELDAATDIARIKEFHW